MNIIFLGRKPYSCKALEYLIEKQINIPFVVTLPKNKPVHWSPKLTDIADKFNIPVISDIELYKLIDNKQLNDIDLVISYLFWKKIKSSLIKLPLKGCINFHPAPLPELRGLGGYNIAILEGLKQYGVSAHYVSENFDEGDLIEVRHFNINPEVETAYSLEQKSQIEMFELFKQTIDKLLKNQTLPKTPQKDGRYITRKDFEHYREIKETDSVEMIQRKIRAFWYPPHHGAFIRINGNEYTLLDESMLKKLGKEYY